MLSLVREVLEELKRGEDEIILKLTKARSQHLSWASLGGPPNYSVLLGALVGTWQGKENGDT